MKRSLRLQPFGPLPGTLWSVSLLALWVLSMIGLPIAQWVFGPEVRPLGITIAALFQASAVFVIVREDWGLATTLRAVLIIAATTWFAEFVGHNTGLPFGEYTYTDALQPQLFGVPLLIPLSWFMLLPSSWMIAQRIVGERRTWQDEARFIGLSAAALTAWDLFLDPQMVGWDLWQWATPGFYFGIPLSNYLGWLLVAGVVTLLVRPRPLQSPLLLVVYGTVWFLQSFGQFFFWNQPGPALFGFLGMGVFLLLAILRKRDE